MHEKNMFELSWDPLPTQRISSVTNTNSLLPQPRFSCVDISRPSIFLLKGLFLDSIFIARGLDFTRIISVALGFIHRQYFFHVSINLSVAIGFIRRQCISCGPLFFIFDTQSCNKSGPRGNLSSAH